MAGENGNRTLSMKVRAGDALHATPGKPAAVGGSQIGDSRIARSPPAGGLVVVSSAMRNIPTGRAKPIKWIGGF
jgi:hypothetical protein